jgi:hypothetical protein
LDYPYIQYPLGGTKEKSPVRRFFISSRITSKDAVPNIGLSYNPENSIPFFMHVTGIKMHEATLLSNIVMALVIACLLDS